MSSYQWNTGSGGCTGWCNRHTYCTHHQVANPVGSEQLRIDQGQHEPENSDVMEKENQQNTSEAGKVIHPPVQCKKARASVEVQNRWSTGRAKNTEKSDAMLNRHLHEEKAKVSKMEEEARRQKQEVKGLEAKVAGLGRHLREKEEASRRKDTELQHLREELEASRRKNTELSQQRRAGTEAFRRKEKGFEAKMAELSQRSRAETEASRRKEKGLEAKVAELTEVFRRKERAMERLEAQKIEIERRLHEKTLEVSKLKEDTRQQSNKERETKRLVSVLDLHVQGKPVKLSDIEAHRRNPTKGESSEQREGRVAELEARISSMEDEARRTEEEKRDLSAKNQEQSDEINQLSARVSMLVEQAMKPPKKVLVRKPDSISMVEVEELLRIVNAQIELLSNRITYPASYQESPAGSAALNDLRDCLGPWLSNALLRKLQESNPLIPQIALQTILAQACSRIINHWNPPFWNDNSIFFRSNIGRAGGRFLSGLRSLSINDLTLRPIGSIIDGTWSALQRTMSQSEVHEAIVKYLSEILVKAIAAVGGPLPNGEIFPPEHQDDVEDITKRVLEFRQIVSKEVKSMDIVTFTVPSDTQFDPSQMIDTERSTDGTGSVRDERVICTLEMGLQYRKRAELGKPGGCGVILKPKVVLPVALET